MAMSHMWQKTGPEPVSPVGRYMEEEEQASLPRVEEGAEKIQALEEELAVLRREQANLHRGIFEAAQIQRRLCAPRQMGLGEFEVAGEIFPVRHLSGDFFKVMELGSALGIAIGDIAGKGLSAGIWLPHLVSLIHRCARTYEDPADLIAQVNSELCAGYGEPPLVALFFARIDLQTGQVWYCNAGLPSPFIFAGGGECASLGVGGPMLGAVPNGIFNSAAVTLQQGHTLIACTDGATECQNPRDEEFELRRLSAAARAVTGSSASHTLFSTLGAVLDFADGCPLNDDLTLLVVRREENPTARARSGVSGSAAGVGAKASAAPFCGAQLSRLVS